MWKLPEAPQPGQQAQQESPQEPPGTAASGNRGSGQDHEQVSTAPKDAPTSASGGGGHRSISAEFNVNPVTGTMSLSLPIYTSPGRSNSGPKLALNYDSGSGNGVFGVGWQLSTLSIARKTSKGIPQYDGSDVFILSSFDDLVPMRAGDRQQLVTEDVVVDGVTYCVQQYKPRVETEVTRIECWTRKDDPNDVHWRTVTAENQTTFFGEEEDSRVFDGVEKGIETRIFSWLASRTVDAAGNAIHFEYKPEDFHGGELLDPEDSICEVNRSDRSRRRMRYLKRVQYGNVYPSRDMDTWKIIKYTKAWMFEVVFDYGDHDFLNPSPEEQRPWKIRENPFSVRSAGFELRTYRLCQRILMFHRFPEQMEGREYALVSSTELNYTCDNGVTLLKSFQSTGYLPVSAKGEHGIYRETLPPVELEYTQITDALGVEVKEVPPDTLHQISTPLGWKTEWIDLDGEGAPGSLLEVPGGSWKYQRNEMLKSSTPETFGPIRELPLRPNTSTQDGHYFEDLSRSGRMNVICLDSTGALEGFYERSDAEAQQWTPLIPFPSTPSVPIQGSATRRIDLTGNGLADLLHEELNGEIFWYPCLGKRGFAPAQKVVLPDDAPRLVSYDTLRQIYLADMTGDGLADIVEVQPGKTSYWPNLGHGRFGRRITMGRSPIFDNQDHFSHRRLHLSDVCGSGTTDMVYLPPGGGIHIYFNLAGNRYSDVMIIPNFPSLNTTSSVFTLDLLGKGVSCLCWTGPDAAGTTPSTLRYVELTGGIKPYLLRRYRNGVGGTTKVTYQPSTKYYLDDEENGHPWTTRLPFPVHCVAQVVTEDCVAQTSKKSRYAYHDGHFDGVEREFRGFGIVEHWDEEEFGGGNVYLQRPPIRTKEWYHVGAATSLMDGRCQESRLSSSHKFPAKLKPEEEFEVHRALKGQKLREELYSDDASDQAHLPYSVEELSYEIHRVQAASDEKNGVYRVSPRESVKTAHERQEADPRIERVLTLEVNEYGDVLKSLTIHHGRQNSDLSDAKGRRQQEITWGIYTEKILTDAVIELECFQRPQPALNRQFAIIGLNWLAYPDIEAITANNLAYLNEMDVIPYRMIDLYHGPTPRKSLVQEQRHYYLDRTLSEALGWREITAYSVLDRSYDLVFQEETLEKHFLLTGLISQASLDLAIDQGGYVRLEHEAGIWNPSSRKIFSQNTAENLQTARRSFYQPSVTIDPFGAVEVLELDEYQCLPRRTIDAVGNIISFDNDYWHLQPSQTIDINGNRLQVAFDAFSCIIGTARMGKKTEELGDSLQDFEPIVGDETMEAFLDDPCGAHTRKLLGGAGTRNLLYRGRFEMVQDMLKPVIPAFQAMITCDAHYRDRTEDSSVGISIAYLDGSGATLQTTMLCRQAKGESPAQWRISEWVIKDSKGNSVRVCQPNYAPDHHFRFEANIDSPKVTNLLDPLDRVRGVLQPDHTWSKQRVTPWSTIDYDVGSTITVENPALDPDVGPFFKSLTRTEYLPNWLEQQNQKDDNSTAEKSLVYAGKRSITCLDSRGQPIGTNVILGNGKSLYTRQTYNMAGHVVAQYDVLDRLIQVQDFDFQGRVLVTRTMDSGQETVLPDCQGKPVFRWTHPTRRFHYLYDLKGREIEKRLTDTEQGLTDVVLQQIIYGDSQADGADRNLRGHIERVCDQSGELKNEKLDFKSNCIAQVYRLAANYKGVLNWDATVELEAEPFCSYASFDALDRVVQATDASGCHTITSYDLLGNVKTVTARLKDERSSRPLVYDKTYGPDGSLLKIIYGNGSTLDHVYDRATRRLVRKTLSRTNRLGRSHHVQDMHYSWDCMGRTVRKRDAAQQSLYFRNSRTDPEWTYNYDALGRLVSATGREQVDSSNAGAYRLLAPGPQKRPSLGLEMCQYREIYRYDDAANILSMHHVALNVPSIAGWTRRFEYKAASQLQAEVMGNRLTRTVTGSVRERYGYGPSPAGQRGCMTSMAGYSILSWNHMDKLWCSSRQSTRDKSVREQTWYVYNAAGMRIRKVTERGGVSAHKMKERIFFPGVDIYRTYSGDGKALLKERVQSHIQSTSTGAVAILERGIADSKGQPSLLVRYQPGDSIELDDAAGLISYEEYTPFGSTILCAFTHDVEAPRKYRYAGYERDSETGLFFCDQRYYAPWLGRWSSPDPLGLVDGANLYQYVRNDPVNMIDPTGTAGFRDKYPDFFPKESRIPGDGGGTREEMANDPDMGKPSKEVKRQTRKAFEKAGIVNLKGLKPQKGKMGALGQKHHIMSQDWEGSFRLLGFDVHAFTLYCSKTANTDVGGKGDGRWNRFWARVRERAYHTNAQRHDDSDSDGEPGSKAEYTLTRKDVKKYIRKNREKLREDVVDIVQKNLNDFVRACDLDGVEQLSPYMVADYYKSTRVDIMPLYLPDEIETLEKGIEAQKESKRTPEEALQNIASNNVMDAMKMLDIKSAIERLLDYGKLMKADLTCLNNFRPF